MLKIYILIGILIFSGNLFSKSMRDTDLIGIWTSPEYTLVRWEFKKNHVLIERETTGFDLLCSYYLDTTINELLVHTEFKKDAISIVEIYKVLKPGQNEIVLQLYKIKYLYTDKSKEDLVYDILYKNIRITIRKQNN